MNALIIEKGSTVYKLYVLHHQQPGMSSPQSSLSVNDADSIPQSVVVERDAKVEIIIVVMPGMNCDIKLDVRLEKEQRLIYMALMYVEEMRRLRLLWTCITMCLIATLVSFSKA